MNISSLVPFVCKAELRNMNVKTASANQLTVLIICGLILIVMAGPLLIYVALMLYEYVWSFNSRMAFYRTPVAEPAIQYLMATIRCCYFNHSKWKGASLYSRVLNRSYKHSSKANIKENTNGWKLHWTVIWLDRKWDHTCKKTSHWSWICSS